MSLDQISFVLGGLLVAVGLLGGGVEVRELKVPAIGQSARILSVVGGVAFIGLALFLTLRHREPDIPSSSTDPLAQSPSKTTAAQPPPQYTPDQQTAPQPQAPALPARHLDTFPQPMYGGFRLDACYESNTRCGEEPATAWCKTKGFRRAVDYPGENVGALGIHTKQIGSQLECGFQFCASFKYITCES